MALICDRVVHRSSGVGICVGRYISYGTTDAAGIFLSCRLRFVSAAVTSRARPDGLFGVGIVRIECQRRATDRGDILRRCGVLHAVSSIAGGERNRNSRMIEMSVVGRGGLTGEFAAAPRVRDDVGVLDSIVFRGQ